MPSHLTKPAKPSPDFPLFPHARGYWAKKIRGRMVYFGPWDKPQAALDKYLEERDALMSGQRPRDSRGLTIDDLCDLFLEAKENLVKSGELSPRTWADYKEACGIVRKVLGKSGLVIDVHPQDFTKLRAKLTNRWGHYRVGNFIQYTRCLFRFASESDYIDKPVKFGPMFVRPSKKNIRKHRNDRGEMMFEASELQRILEAASHPMKAMILLGVNCGFGNADCGRLPTSAVDLERGWLRYPREKTGVKRRCPLWPETVQAIKDAWAQRPPNGEAFRTERGLSWFKTTADSPITKEMRKLLDGLKINGHRNFYALRHTFRTIADETKDQPAVDLIMGHEKDGMSERYRERISDERLLAVTEYVRAWTFRQSA